MMNTETANRLLKTLEIDRDISEVTIRDINVAFRKLALKFHPDKGVESEKQKRTVAFTELRLAYEKLKKYIGEKQKHDLNDDEENQEEKDEEEFFSKNFEKFNFPHENKGSFTIKIEEHLADSWQECITNLLGEPRRNPGTECERIWKVNHGGIDITLHIYDKPKNKKGSKLMLQGGSQAVLCSYVFKELPRIYKVVTTKIPSIPQFSKKVSRKSTQLAVKCEKCNYKSTLIAMKMHMKGVHGPKPSKASKRLHNFTPKIKDVKRSKTENMILNSEGIVDTSTLLEESYLVREIPALEETPVVSTMMLEMEDTSCNKCGFDGRDETELKEHLHNCHERSSELDSDKIGGKILTEFFCNICEFITDNGESLEVHMNSIHTSITTKDSQEKPSLLVLEQADIAEHPIGQGYKCNSCQFKTMDYENYKIHMDTTHMSLKVQVKQTQITNINKPEVIRFECTQCDFTCPLRIQLQKHLSSKHEWKKCDGCTYSTNIAEKMAAHKESYHAMIDFYCNICGVTARTPYLMQKHKVEEHNQREEAKYNTMQELFLSGLVAQVDNLMLAIIGSKEEVCEKIETLQRKNEVLETELIKTKVELNDLKGALKKSNEFSNDKLHDSEAMLRNISDRCSKLEKVANELTKSAKTEPKDEVSKPLEAKEVKRRKKHKLGWVVTSNSNHLDKSKLEKDLNVDVAVERAVPNVIRNDDIDTLVLQSDGVEITNIDVNTAVMDTTKNIEEYKKEWFERVEEASEKLFDIAEDALKKTNNLKKVMIVKRLPRHDRSRDDIIGIKSKLSRYGNAYFNQLWDKRGSPENIKIVELAGMETNGYPYLHDIVYGKHSSPDYDGIHLQGLHAKRHYTYRAVQAMKPEIIGASKQSKVNNPRDYHLTCPQAMYQKKQAKRLYSEIVSGRYTIPTYNKYAPLN